MAYVPASVVLQSITLYRPPGTVNAGSSLQFTAVGSYDNGQTVDLTQACAWSSSSPAVAGVRYGLVKTPQLGNAVISADYQGVHAEATVTVGMPALVRIVIAYEAGTGLLNYHYAYDDPTVTTGKGVTFRAFGYYGDETLIDITDKVIWTSSVPAVAAVDTGGWAGARSPGSTVISAEIPSENGKTLTDSRNLTVTPPPVYLFLVSPEAGSFVNKTETTVSGTVFSESKEVGVTVNGVPAAIFGRQFTARVQLPEGDSVITAKAIDGNGATAETSVMAYAEPINPIRLVANIESGTGPLEAVLRIEGYADGATPSLNATGPGAVEFIDCSSYDACRVRMTAEGIYTFTATGTGADGSTYTDTIAVTVLPKTDLDALLKSKWEGMKAALVAGNIEGALAFFTNYEKDEYRESFTVLQNIISSIAANMGDIDIVYVNDSIAKYEISREQIINGQQETMIYDIYFTKREDGTWGIEQF